MTRQYYRPSRQGYRGQKAQKASFAWLWLLTGLFLGILIAMMGIQNGFLNPIQWLSNLQVKKTPSTVVQSTISTNAPSKKEAQQFEFYNILPGMEVPLPEQAANKTPPNQNLKPQPQSTEPKPQSASTPTHITTQPSVTTTTTTPMRKERNKAHKALYLLQAGMFKHPKVADELKAKLILQGFSTKVQKIEVQDGCWFRVLLGPYATEALALEQKKRLATQKINSTVVLQNQS